MLLRLFASPHKTIFHEIHAPTRGATRLILAEIALNAFQFTRPRGARPTRTSILPTTSRFQFTRPRGARRKKDAGIQALSYVSIHAPARGATEERRRDSGSLVCFNSRAREGRDGNYGGKCQRLVRFNSRAREGRDYRFGMLVRLVKFQFTRPRGARQRGSVSLMRANSFNSRAREGRDGKHA